MAFGNKQRIRRGLGAAVLALLVGQACTTDSGSSAPESLSNRRASGSASVLTGDDVEVHPTYRTDTSPPLRNISAPVGGLSSAPGVPAADAAPTKRKAKSQDRKKRMPLPTGLPGEGAVQRVRIGAKRTVTSSGSTSATGTVGAAPITGAAPTVGTSFDSIGRGYSTFTVNSAPPDTNSAVGLTQIITIVNSGLTVQNKSGTRLYGPVNTNAIFAGFGGACETTNDGDGVVRYDRLADRWLVSQFANVSSSTGPFYECVAISTSSDALGTWYRYAFEFADFPDYPKVSVWPDAYYITYNMFSAAGAWRNGKSCALDRAKMLQGLAATQVCFNTSSSYGSLLAADVDSPTAPPNGAPNVHIALGATTSSLAAWKFKPDFTTPANSTFTGPTSIPVSPYSIPCSGGGACVPQLGTSNTIDSLGDRLMFRLAYWNFGDRQALLATHAVAANSTVGVRWYELRLGGNDGATPSVFQQGTFAPDSTRRWMSSAAFDKAGNIALGYSISSSTMYPGIAITGRFPHDPLGVMTQGETIAQPGAGSQTGSLRRWGDYSSMNIDPADDCTFWFTTEYLKTSGSFNWSTRVVPFTLPGCKAPYPATFSMTASPTSGSTFGAASLTSTISTAVTFGDPQTVSLSATGLPAGTTASFSPASITAGDSSTLTVTTTDSTPAGTHLITVTGTGTESTHSVAFTLNVSDFGVSLSPTSLSLAQGASGTSTVTVSRTGTAQSVALSASGLPSGATATFNSTTVTSGGSTVVTIAVSPTTQPGTYPITISGTGTAKTKTATLSLTVRAPLTNPFTNPDFETGSTTGWTATGTTAAVTAFPRAGTYSAQLGSSTPQLGTSSINQTVTAPTGATRLTVWYRITCPSTRDYALVTLFNASTNKTSNVLKTCTNNQGWKQLIIAVTAGVTYRLNLASYDDGRAGLATFTQYDDVRFE